MDQQNKVGDYILQKVIGVGTFSKVLLAKHILTNQYVAVKVVQKQSLENRKDNDRLIRQFCILRKSRHPYVLQLLQLIEDSKYYYIVSQYCQKGQLFDYIVYRGRIEEHQACLFLQQLVQGLIYLHKIGVAHRDLKPQNLLLDSNYNLKIVDFGLSRQFQANQMLLTSCGSPCYAPPQMLDGNPYDPCKSDVWSVGVILFAMLCGYLPFQSQDNSILFDRIKQGKFQIPFFLSFKARDLINTILKINPIQRPSLFLILKHSFCNPKLQIIRGLYPKQAILDQHILSYFPDNPFLINQLKQNRHNNTTAHYQLLLRKLMKKQGKTVVQYFRMLQDRRFAKPVKQYRYGSQDNKKRDLSVKEKCLTKYLHLFRQTNQRCYSKNQIRRRSQSSRSRASSLKQHKKKELQIIQKQCNNEPQKDLHTLKRLNVPASFVSSKIAAVLANRFKNKLI